MQMKLELVIVPVADVDRALAFYRDGLGFVEDHDVRPADGVRVVQLTPPGSVKGLHLVVPDLEAARAELEGRGVEVGELQDVGGGVRYAGLSDPDGNTLTLQEMAWRTGDAF